MRFFHQKRINLADLGGFRGGGRRVRINRMDQLGVFGTATQKSEDPGLKHGTFLRLFVAKQNLRNRKLAV